MQCDVQSVWETVLLWQQITGAVRSLPLRRACFRSSSHFLSHGEIRKCILIQRGSRNSSPRLSFTLACMESTDEIKRKNERLRDRQRVVLNVR
ncbi:hypothetical protein IRJ41_013066 [Triplophysa rosa]|uniref:Uncharacterized protein n=1 Tax=Triplophysa rosa TaxID=992332 RepID=A0A9W7WNT9_TRIRA|nr:hypothetical protein IRJ41_013066 [Triplophysa rosa]